MSERRDGRKHYEATPDAIAGMIRAVIETARQDGYDDGYADALSLTRDGTAQQLVQESGVGEAGQRVA